jgi:hypothetical protein
MLRAQTSRGDDMCQFSAQVASRPLRRLAAPGRFFLMLSPMVAMENNSKMFGAN